jgi:hypothetical protein
MGAPVRGGTVVEAATCTAVRGKAEGGKAEGLVRSGVSSSPLWLEPRSMEERRYSWLEDHLARLEGKEARSEYYARLG